MVRILSLLILLPFLASGSSIKKQLVKKDLPFAEQQVQRMIDVMEESGKILSPRTTKDGKIRYTSFQDWTSGFFPGSLWYLYKLTGKEEWKKEAEKYTEALDKIQYLTWHHDIGFMIQCSYGNGLRFADKEAYKPVIVQAATSLSTRVRPGAGIIQSWNVTGGWQAKRGWTCPVIIDNMMNLELLFEATALSGDSSFYKIAVSHADQTLKYHFRPDNSSYHVVDYDPETGKVLHRHTAQGYAHESAWARGQAWALYGYTVCYRYTKNKAYLEQAEKIAAYLFSHPRMPEDLVPYWDFDAPNIPNEPRDASAAAIIASALYELNDYSKNNYRKTADRIMESLSSPAYTAKPGENGNFILMHSVGSIPHGSEIDEPLVYADYYFLEAMERRTK